MPHAASDAMAAGGGVVLFSPAAASFDQYDNFEQRGDAFCALVEDCLVKMQGGRVMIGLTRKDKGLLADWWWTIDRWLLLGLVVLVGLGFIMAFAASPAVAHRLELPTYHFCVSSAHFLNPRAYRGDWLITFAG